MMVNYLEAVYSLLELVRWRMIGAHDYQSIYKSVNKAVPDGSVSNIRS